MAENIFEYVLSRADIVKTIEGYTALTKKGKNYMGLCPFHSEKTPSFSVSREEGLFHCFGCGESGNTVSFIAKIEGLSKLDAVKKLAADHQIDISAFEHTSRYEKKDLHMEILREAALFYFKYLRKSEEGLAYLMRRGLTMETVREFGLGFAPSGWTELADRLLKKYSLEDLQELGLVKKGQSGRPYDMFRNKIMFPIFSITGKVLGFGARSIDGSLPKYINSKESGLFHKSELLFGIHKIKGKGRVLLTEGYMDVLALYNRGVERAVAALGTSFTAHQAQLISRYTDDVYLCFDSDEAGRKATNRAIELFQGLRTKLHVVELGDGLDPDEYIRKFGKESFEEKLSSAVPAFEYRLKLLSYRYNLNQTAEKLEFLKAASNLIKTLGSEFEKQHYCNYLSHHYGADIDIVRKAVFSFFSKSKPKVPESPGSPLSRNTLLERSLLGVVAHYYDSLTEAEAERIRQYPFSSESKKILDLMFEIYQSGVKKLNPVTVVQYGELTESKQVGDLLREKFDLRSVMLHLHLHELEEEWKRTDDPQRKASLQNEKFEIITKLKEW